MRRVNLFLHCIERLDDYHSSYTSRKPSSDLSDLFVGDKETTHISH